MKLEKYTADSRGKVDYGWLQANYSFSFSNFFDPKRIRFGSLRVLNDDVIAANMGFNTHPHNNMEIITIPLKGVLKHKDSMSNEWLFVKPNEVQVMSAGTGIQHSEKNASNDESLSLFQIWILPQDENVKPRYNQAAFNPEERKNELQILVSSIDDKDVNGLKIHQNAQISRIDLEKDSNFTYKLKSKKHGVYIMTISGEVKCGSEILNQRDALTVTNSNEFVLESGDKSELLFIEVLL